ncbi:molybdate ABC transporter substrate-binding protein [Pseudokordiimonas caeni]|uniref:molybdate ABC transporter substrate-binding protein n=1 Tax=Pseudokordiimonas caeni TaxID=2997908 RepID=UPI002811BD18|nr:molybdate ABC transporter substrate-binding protein [Pseudokordiimonas caeni]
MPGSLHHTFLTALMALGLLLAPAANAQSEERHKPIIFAAASLVEVLPAILGPNDATYVFGPSATLARQIDAGAPADIYISANADWTDWLVKAGKLHDVQMIAGNRLVLAVPAGDTARERTIIDAASFMEIIGNRRLAIADPRSAPAGVYAQAFLAHLGLADSMKDRLAMGESVRATLRLVERGGLPGLVYESDTAGNLAVRMIVPIAAEASGAVRYSGGVVSDRSDLAALLARLTAPDAAVTWKRFGFVANADMPHNGTE